ncbi:MULTISPECIES: hypothetical protein [Methanosarcina]|nr:MULTISPECIES: hypothetical protein [Methanosarcina]
MAKKSTIGDSPKAGAPSGKTQTKVPASKSSKKEKASKPEKPGKKEK